MMVKIYIKNLFLRPLFAPCCSRGSLSLQKPNIKDYINFSVYRTTQKYVSCFSSKRIFCPHYSRNNFKWIKMMFIIFHELLCNLKKKTQRKFKFSLKIGTMLTSPLIKNCNKSSFTELKLSVSCSFFVFAFVF